MKNQAFTLIELLVVVLIIGILVAIALPKYQESVEKSIMQEALINLKTISQANDIFFLRNGRYANAYEMNQLDISIPGTLPNINYTNNHQMTVRTKNFEYRPDGDSGNINNPVPDGFKAIAQRVPRGDRYYLYMSRSGIIRCANYNNATSVQQKLCNQINTFGHL